MMKNNPFEVHGVEHLSASSINQFISSPCHWILKVSGYKSSSNPAMWRGTAIDNAICNSFDLDLNQEQKIQRSIVNAEMDFDSLHEYYQSEKDYDLNDVGKEREKLEPWVKLGVDFYNKLEWKPIECQRKIEIEFEDIPIPIIGYIDLTYEDCIRDIKTTARLLSETPLSICRQLSLYSVAEDKPALVDFLHVTSKQQQVVTREITNVENHVSVLKKAAFAMMNVLSYSDDIYTVASLFYPDYDYWMWSDEDKVAAKQLWSI
jgi:hypothetical protein